MVQRCCVPLCETKVGDVDINGVKVRFHRIPLTPEKFRKWRDGITNVGEYKPEPELTVNSRICSKHFLREDYISEENTKEKPGTPGNHVLAKDSIPTVFKWNDSSGKECKVSRAIPYVKKIHGTTSQQQEEAAQGKKSQEIQCSLLQEETLQQEIYRKNLVIRQLLQRLAELEETDNNKSGCGESSSSGSQLQYQNQSLQPTAPTNSSKATETDDLISIVNNDHNQKSNQLNDTNHDQPFIRSIQVQVIRRALKESDYKIPPKKRKIHEF